MPRSDARRARLSPLRLLILGLGVGALAAGCSVLSPREDPSRFFLLTSPAGVDDVVTTGGGSIAVGPVDLPGYLNGPTLVTRLDDHEVRISDYERWAEPLDDNLLRVLVANLSDELPDHVVPFPGPIGQPVRLRVPIVVQRFEPDSLGNVDLWASWSLEDPEGGTTIETRESRIRESTRGPGPEASVATMSAALARLAEEIAAAIEQWTGGEG